MKKTRKTNKPRGKAFKAIRRLERQAAGALRHRDVKKANRLLERSLSRRVINPLVAEDLENENVQS